MVTWLAALQEDIEHFVHLQSEDFLESEWFMIVAFNRVNSPGVPLLRRLARGKVSPLAFNRRSIEVE